jgi:3-deoxy-manno-octulosonate cytidylyltransferase (CMP-KDO synthetase)
MDYHVVIPARFSSSRLPGKPLALVAGVPMIVRVAQQAAATTAASIVVATDDARVERAVTEAGFQAMLTDPAHPSGSDRIMEVAAAMGWPDDSIVVNVQGDEPLIPPAIIEQVAAGLLSEAQRAVYTLCETVDSKADLFDPNQVKVVFDSTGRALYFSRAPIPFARGDFTLDGPVQAEAALPQSGRWYRHVGIYGYRLNVLRRFVALPVSALESIEMLEQLRLLDNGIEIHVGIAGQRIPPGVDTPADLERVNALFADPTPRS